MSKSDVNIQSRSLAAGRKSESKLMLGSISINRNFFWAPKSFSFLQHDMEHNGEAGKWSLKFNDPSFPFKKMLMFRVEMANIGHIQGALHLWITTDTRKKYVVDHQLLPGEKVSFT